MAKMTKEEKAARKEARLAKRELERMTGILHREKRDCLENLLPEPSHKYAIGDRVRYGAWDWTGILETFRGSTLYKCFSVTWNTGRNVPDAIGCKIHYEPWYRLRKYRTASENEDIDLFEQDDDIHFGFQNRDIRSLINQYVNRWGIDLSPEYQRGNVWTAEQKEALIDSVFKHVDIGKFAVIKREFDINEKGYEMLDGKQRLTALVEFYLGRFTYRGKYFQDLGYRDQGHFMNHSISYAESRDLTNEQKYRYFLKLNTTGTPVDPAHMEKVANMLKNETTRMRATWTKEIEEEWTNL